MPFTNTPNLAPSDRRTILAVDDDESQRCLLERTVSSFAVDYHLQLLSSGNEAIAYLAGLGRFEDRKTYPLPVCIITDLHMIHGDGRAVLKFVKRMPSLSAIPVAVLSSSDDPEDVQQCHFLGCTSYFVKPVTQIQLHELLQKVPGRPLARYASPVEQRSNLSSASVA